MAKIKKEDAKKFPLRILNPKVYPSLETEAKGKYTSVNSLINSILEAHQKKIKNNSVKSL